MATDRRLLRLQQLVLETVATTVQRDLDDPRVGMVTVTRVKLARDLTQAVVYWSSLEEGAPRRTAERGLTDALPYLQAKVAEVMLTRHTPRLSLRFDEGMHKAVRVEDLIDKVAQEREARGEPAPPPAPGTEDIAPRGARPGTPKQPADRPADAPADAPQAPEAADGDDPEA